MHEYAFLTSGPSMSSEQTIVRVRNRGRLDHELVLLELPEDLSSLEEQLRGSQRRAVDTVFILPTRRPGQAGVFAVDLRPGRYAYACFIKDSDGEIHARKGMTFEFEIS